VKLVHYLLLCLFFQSAFAVEVPKGATFAAKVINLDTGEVKFEHNADSLMVPASTQKLVTLYSALSLLDVQDAFKTSILADGKIKNGILQGNLYLKFTGDPELTLEQLSNMISELKSIGIIKISKDVVIDDSEFDDEYFGHGWSIDQTRFCYSAPISSMIIDKNCLKFSLIETQKGFDVKSHRSPIFTDIKDQSIHADFDDMCEFELKAYSDNRYTLNGCYQKKTLPRYLQIAIQDPRKNGIDLISHILKENGIEYKSIKTGLVKANSKELLFVKSRPIIFLLEDMVKKSDNVISEAIFKRISAKNSSYAGGWKNSSKLVNNILKSNLKIEHHAIIKDGSGISRKNLISPDHFVSILKASYEDSKLRDDFLTCMPASGINGTLEFRFNNSILKNAVFAKTGTLDNVSALSGYAFISPTEKYAFSIMINSTTLKYKEIKNFEDEFLINLLTNK